MRLEVGVGKRFPKRRGSLKDVQRGGDIVILLKKRWHRTVVRSSLGRRRRIRGVGLERVGDVNTYNIEGKGKTTYELHSGITREAKTCQIGL